MPMDFKDMDALKRSFDSKDRVPLKKDETEADYRERCAVYMETVWKDVVEANEIRTGKGWDKWTDAEAAQAVKRHPDPMSNPMLLTRMLGKKTK